MFSSFPHTMYLCGVYILTSVFTLNTVMLCNVIARVTRTLHYVQFFPTHYVLMWCIYTYVCLYTEHSYALQRHSTCYQDTALCSVLSHILCTYVVYKDGLWFLGIGPCCRYRLKNRNKYYKHLYLAGILFVTFGGKNENRQNIRPRSTVLNSVTWTQSPFL